MKYRCTRFYPYRSPGCPGHTDLGARQGYYIDAKSKEEALAEMAERFPSDVIASIGDPSHPAFTADRWIETAKKLFVVTIKTTIVVAAESLKEAESLCLKDRSIIHDVALEHWLALGHTMTEVPVGFGWDELSVPYGLDEDEDLFLYDFPEYKAMKRKET